MKKSQNKKNDIEYALITWPKIDHKVSYASINSILDKIVKHGSDDDIVQDQEWNQDQ